MSAAATVAPASGAAVAAAEALPAMAVATLAVAEGPFAAVPAVLFHPAVAADADTAGTAPAEPVHFQYNKYLLVAQPLLLQDLLRRWRRLGFRHLIILLRLRQVDRR